METEGKSVVMANDDWEEEEEDAGEDHNNRRKRKASGAGGSALPSCQAQGCDADMAGAKLYHRRHKVCEFHAKASVVLVSCRQQRFCQQCSRFHDLSEFDEAKRSCRRRLAGHNERRRKSSYDSH